MFEQLRLGILVSVDSVVQLKIEFVIHLKEKELSHLTKRGVREVMAIIIPSIFEQSIVEGNLIAKYTDEEEIRKRRRTKKYKNKNSQIHTIDNAGENLALSGKRVQICQSCSFPAHLHRSFEELQMKVLSTDQFSEFCSNNSMQNCTMWNFVEELNYFLSRNRTADQRNSLTVARLPGADDTIEILTVDGSYQRQFVPSGLLEDYESIERWLESCRGLSECLDEWMKKFVKLDGYSETRQSINSKGSK
ncbi:hypothetical protein WN51_03864 [Melipona quadrifasciata]|uniref:Uncharacterized protein n=1 Tax=Melipona quadrifasciata TaxID=166423 RepID=A0A0N0U7I1_9HYME|nr:hypothetical protein WN51_03864 [Melipona quadrifasciata]